MESLPVGREDGIPITKRSRMASLDGRSQETGQSKHEVNGQVTDEGVSENRKTGGWLGFVGRMMRTARVQKQW